MLRDNVSFIPIRNHIYFYAFFQQFRNILIFIDFIKIFTVIKLVFLCDVNRIKLIFILIHILHCLQCGDNGNLVLNAFSAKQNGNIYFHNKSHGLSDYRILNISPARRSRSGAICAERRGNITAGNQ